MSDDKAIEMPEAEHHDWCWHMERERVSTPVRGVMPVIRSPSPYTYCVNCKVMFYEPEAI